MGYSRGRWSEGGRSGIGCTANQIKTGEGDREVGYRGRPTQLISKLSISRPLSYPDSQIRNQLPQLALLRLIKRISIEHRTVKKLKSNYATVD